MFSNLKTSPLPKKKKKKKKLRSREVALLLTCAKGPSPITGILFQTNDVRLSWTPPPPPPNEHIHYMHMEKMLTKKCRYCLHDAEHMVVSSSQKYFREGVMSVALQKGFSCASPWAGLEQAFRHSLCASLTALTTARDHEVCESALQKTSTNSGLDMKASLWAKFVILWITSSP